jgi:hypothetical protein
MGLKGYRLWVMGQLDSNVQSPTTMASISAGSEICFSPFSFTISPGVFAPST